jgi:hypothetical protein
MTCETRDRLLNTLAEISPLSSQVRFGQLIANLSTAARGATAESIWDVEDEELLEAAQSLLRSLQSRDVERVASARP